MSYINSLTENKQALIISIVYALCCKCFKCVYMQYIPKYEGLFSVLSICISLYMIGYVLRQFRNTDFSHYVALLALLFYSSLVVGCLFHGQIGYSPLKALCVYTGPMMIMIFFLLQKNNVSHRVLLKAIAFCCILYCTAYIIGTITFPNQIFGFDTSEDKQDQIMDSADSRGVLRLFIFGSQIIPLTIYTILTYFKKKKKYYLLLIPLYILLMMQGARTPFFICILVSIVYIIINMKHKFIVFLAAIFIYLGGLWLYNHLLTSTSDDALTLYVQMTQKQVENNEDNDDIRLEMSKYFFMDYNEGNILQIIFGNGFPDGKSDYAKGLSRLSTLKRYFACDVGITQIFLYMGVIGIWVYIILFFKGIRTQVPDEYAYGKLFLFHYALISFANNAMVEYGMFTFGLALYSIYRANYEMNIAGN